MLLKKEMEYKVLAKWIGEAVRRGKPVVIIVSNEVKVKGMAVDFSIYGYNGYVLYGHKKTLGSMFDAGLVMYIKNDEQIELQRLLAETKTPVALIYSDNLDFSELKMPTVTELYVPGLTNSMLPFVVKELVALFKSTARELSAYVSKETQGRNKLGVMMAEWRKTWYTTTRLPRRTRIAKWCLPQKNRKRKP